MALQATITVLATAGETLSALAWRTLGRHRGAVEQILEVNPGLAALAEALPEGTPVIIPPAADSTALDAAPLVQLWD